MSDNLDKLDFDVSYSIIFGKEEVDLIDIYEPKTSTFEVRYAGRQICYLLVQFN